MSRSGVVAAISRRGLVAIETPDDGYTIVEPLGGFELELGHEMAWTNDHALGTEVYRNLSTGERGEVFVENHSVSKAGLAKQL